MPPLSVARFELIKVCGTFRLLSEAPLTDHKRENKIKYNGYGAVAKVLGSHLSTGSNPERFLKAQ